MPARWTAAIIVCRKCEKKLGGGFGPGGRHRLSKLLNARAGGGKGRKAGIGVIESKCLKLCPKRAVTVVNGARPEEWLVVEAGAPIEEVAARLGLATAATNPSPRPCAGVHCHAKADGADPADGWIPGRARDDEGGPTPA